MADKPFLFPEIFLTPRKREILMWLQENNIEFRHGIDPQDAQKINHKWLRIYVPLGLSRINWTRTSQELPSPLRELLLELFDFRFRIEFIDAYPTVDKYRLFPIDNSWD